MYIRVERCEKTLSVVTFTKQKGEKKKVSQSYDSHLLTRQKYHECVLIDVYNKFTNKKDIAERVFAVFPYKTYLINSLSWSEIRSAKMSPQGISKQENRAFSGRTKLWFIPVIYEGSKMVYLMDVRTWIVGNVILCTLLHLSWMHLLVHVCLSLK